MTTKIVLLFFASSLFLSLAAPSFAEDEYNVTTGFAPGGTSLALRGVDAIALTTRNAQAYFG
ncbi:hypothetical protein [Thalassovita aquimarina]|uniref:Uncharacterized protein n=1 Tax=Thalassovita aquimarina TaxID=2785917 RepID=A0ABS5HVH2_9RHOB|nr:hypothetical protein [Thalassovita aquimarina]MBR9652995.1 hypothetical protein [Thalassovita aquimarina]